MGTILTIFVLIAAILLIVVVLLQPGKGDLSATFGGISGQMGSMFGMQKTATILTKFTWAMITVIVVFALAINIFFVDKGTAVQTNPSLMGQEPDTQQGTPVPGQQAAPAQGQQPAPAQGQQAAPAQQAVPAPAQQTAPTPAPAPATDPNQN